VLEALVQARAKLSPLHLENLTQRRRAQRRSSWPERVLIFPSIGQPFALSTRR
jgi:hypothetical protein